MSKTKGNPPMPSRDEIIRNIPLLVSLVLYFDVSEEAQKAGLVDILIFDLKEPRWEDATHEFYVVFNRNVACYVGRMSNGAYVIEPDRQNPYFAQELDIRERVLDMALRHFIADYPSINDMRKRILRGLELLVGNKTRGNVPIVRDERPDFLSLDKGKTELQAERQWSVQIGDYYCEIGLFGTDDNGNPILVPFTDE